MQSDLGGLDLLTPVFHSGNGSSNCFWGVPNPFTPHSAFPESETWLVFDTCPLFISSHVEAVFVAVSVCLGGRTLLSSLERCCGTADWFQRRPFIFRLVSVVLFFLFWRLSCSSVHRGGIGVTVFFCLFVFLQRFKSWNSVMMKGPFKEAQVGWEQWQSERQIQRKELTSQSFSSGSSMWVQSDEIFSHLNLSLLYFSKCMWF